MEQRIIKIEEYNPDWADQFNQIETLLRDIFGQQLLEIHHAGSTAIPGLAAKPIIDIWIGVKNISDVDELNTKMRAIGFTAKGEAGMLFRRFFVRGVPNSTCNVHVFEQGSPEIERTLCFRDYLRSHPKIRDQYGQLKQELAKKFPNDIYQYVIGKEAFVQSIDRISGYHGNRMVQAMSTSEWDAYHRIREQEIFSRSSVVYDRNHPTITGKQHKHFVFFHDVDIVGVLHIEFFDPKSVAIRTIAIDGELKNQGLGSELLALAERWLKEQDVQLIRLHANPPALSFYRRHGYSEHPFPDPDQLNKDCIDMAKTL